MMNWKVIQSPTDPEMYAVAGAYLVADNLPIEDANLIAGAPDSLAALKALHVSGDLGRLESNASGTERWEATSARINAARAAIAKAAGK